MNSELIASGFFYFILYTSFVLAAIPFIFFFFWRFLSFWQKHHPAFFYLMFLGFCVGIPVAFALTQHFWFTTWYYPFPKWLQIVGLIIIFVAYCIIKLAEYKITVAVRLFWPVLKNQKFHLKTDGLYKYVRHPIYAIFPLVLVGGLFYTGELVILPVLLLNLLARNWYARKEERYVETHAIGDYEKYKKQTPYRFYPKFR